jgi:hypothetical protein
MEQNPADTLHNPVFYNHRLMEWRRIQLGLSIHAIERLTGIHRITIRAVFQGNGSYEKVYQIVCLLGLDWALVHERDLPESMYHRAVAGGVLPGAHLIAPQQPVSNSL